jgi:N-acetylmuramoyl-L-alanine amidase
MRSIDSIIIHCSATPAGREVTVEEIDRWHRQRGFRCIGYHYVIYLDGSLHEGRPLEEVGAHCEGHNAHSIGICYIGGVSDTFTPLDTRTVAQRATLHRLLQELKERFPKAQIYGHRDFSAKACPSFDARREYAQR